MNARRVLCMVLLVVMCLSTFVGCKKDTGSTSTPSTSVTTTPSTSESTTTPKETETSTPTPEVILPSSATLVGTKHLPPIDSQGSIGSCSAQAVTYTQFTVAVSQYVNNVLGDTTWDPSSGLKKYIFSPKFSFVYSGAGTQYSYDILVDQGCLPLTMSTFYKPNDTSDKVNGAGSVASHKLSKCWDVDLGELAEALKYRLGNYEEVEFDAYNYDFTTDMGQALMKRVKDAVNRGNVVAVCGWSSYWEYLEIEETGTLGKKGDYAIWLGKNGTSSDGNHAVSIVGYDDDITLTVGGATMKGAFQIANSWGDTFRNDGYVWMMYDSLNRVSGHPELADEGFYSGSQAFYSNQLSDSARVLTMYKTQNNMLMNIKATGDKANIGGKAYDIYTVQDKVYNKYLSYNEGGEMEWTNKVGNNCEFAFIPFEDYSQWKNVNITDENSEYVGSYLVCAVNKCVDPAKSECFISLGNSSTATGRICSIEKLVSKTNLQYFAFMLSGYKNEGEKEFVSSIKTHYPVVTATQERTGTLYRTSFVYWEDILVNQTNVIIEAEIEAVKREAIKMTLTRSDASGNVVTRVPQIIKNLLTLSNELDTEGDTRFDGDAANGTYDKAYFAFGFNDLAQLGGNYKMEDLLWGVTIEGNSLGIKVKSLTLRDVTGKIYSTIKINEADSNIGKGEEKSFYFDLGKGIKSYSAAPAEDSIIYSVGANKYLERKGASFVLASEMSEDSALDFVYDASSKTYSIMDDARKYALDVKGGKLEDNAQLFLNTKSDTRDTQKWLIETNSDNSFTIKSAVDSNYKVTFDTSAKKLVISSSADNKGYDKWNAFSKVITPIDIKAENEGGKIKISGIVPSKYTSGDITIRITNQDGTYNPTTLTVTPKDGAYSAETNLSSGTYLFTAVYNGKIYGFQYIFTVN